jgi:hypothetical protein
VENNKIICDLQFVDISQEIYVSTKTDDLGACLLSVAKDGNKRIKNTHPRRRFRQLPKRDGGQQRRSHYSKPHKIHMCRQPSHAA